VVLGKGKILFKGKQKRIGRKTVPLGIRAKDETIIESDKR
jgi:hypothetical protein